MSARRADRRIRRLPVVVVIAALLAAAVALDVGRSRSSTESTIARVGGPFVPASGAVSTAWYCAEGTSSSGGRATESIIVANLDTQPAEALVTVLSGSDQPPKSRTVTVKPRSQARVAVSDVLATPDPGVVVEVFGGRSVVEHAITALDDLAVSPCAREPSARWLFASGTTVKGTQQWLSLFNPFGDDAKVDIRFYTDTGVQEPIELQGLEVPRRTRIAKPIHDIVRRQGVIATEIRTRTGRVVAEQSLLFDGTEEREDPGDPNKTLAPRKGLSLSLGATALGTEWVFPAADRRDGESTSIGVVNPSPTPTEVEVSTFLDGDAVLAPQTVALPPSSVVLIDAGQRVPANAGFSISVQATTSTPVVAEELATWTSPSPGRGVATIVGARDPATDWAFAMGRWDDNSSTLLSVYNPGTKPVTATLSIVAGGSVTTPKEARDVEIKAGKRVVFDAAALGASADAALVVRATGTVVAERDAGTGGRTLSLGIPFLPGPARHPATITTTTTTPTTTTTTTTTTTAPPTTAPPTSAAPTSAASTSAASTSSPAGAPAPASTAPQ